MRLPHVQHQLVGQGQTQHRKLRFLLFALCASTEILTACIDWKSSALIIKAAGATLPILKQAKKTTLKANGTLEHQPTAWSVPY